MYDGLTWDEVRSDVCLANSEKEHTWLLIKQLTEVDTYRTYVCNDCKQIRYAINSDTHIGWEEELWYLSTSREEVKSLILMHEVMAS
jgi:hypothetical protein